MKLSYLAVLIVTTTFMISSASAASFDWRPSCTLYDTPQQIPEPLNWSESHDTDDRSYCLYNDTSTEMLDSGLMGNATIWMQQDLSTDFLTGELSRSGSNPDLHISNLNYSQSKSIGHPSEGVYVEFDYYRPYRNGDCVDQIPQYIVIGNDEADFSEGSGTFDDAFYQLDYTDKCGQWNHFRQPVEQFTNDYGSSFSKSSKTIGAISLEMANMYVKNIKLVGMSGSNVYHVW